MKAPRRPDPWLLSLSKWALITLAAAPALLPLLAWLLWSFSAGSFSSGWPSAEGWMLFTRSCAFAATTALFASGLGLLGALRILSAGSLQKGRALLLLATLLVAPAIHGLGWATTTAQMGAILRVAGGPDMAFHGIYAALWVNTLAYAPLATGLAVVALLQVDPMLLEAGRMFQPEGRILRRVLLGLAAPQLALGASLVFLFAMQDFTVPSLFSVPVYAMGLFARFAAERNPSALLAQALPLLAIALLLLLLVTLCWKTYAGQRVGGPAKPLGGIDVFAGRPLLGRLADLWLCFPALAPVILVLSGWDGPRWAAAIRRAAPDLGYSLELGITVAVMAVLFGSVLGWQFAKAGRGMGAFPKVLMGLLLAPLAIPSVLGSIGALRLVQFLPQFYEELGPVVTMLSRALPLTALLFMVACRRLDPELMEAARLLGRNRWQRLWRVHLQMLGPTAAASAVLAFALTLGECSGMILVLPPGRGTLATRLFNLLHYGAGPDVAALSTLLSLLAFAVALLAAWAVQRGTKWRMTP